jgi:TfoX/Sxy family transcriptional regulator of competence genes
MPYDEATAERIRSVLKRTRGLTEKKMFGGIAFLIHGHMACGVLDKTLVLRLGNDGAAAALQEKHTRPMDFTGKPMKSMLYVEPTGFRTDEALKSWVRRAVTHARSLPPKD